MHIVAANTDHFSNPKKYYGIQLQDLFHIEELFSLHYFEYMSTFSFPGESHDFWEFVCVDKGEVEIGAGPLTHTLRRGEIAFHYPGEFHWVKANGKIAPNLIVISFAQILRWNFSEERSFTSKKLNVGCLPESLQKQEVFWKDGWTIPIRHPCRSEKIHPLSVVSLSAFI